MSSILLEDIPYTFEDPSLVDDHCFIGGKWAKATGGATFGVEDPSTQKIVAHIPDFSVEEVTRCIESAHEAFLTYKTFSPRKRGQLLQKWADLVRAARNDLAALCTLELGKPFTESLGTVNYALDYLDWFANLAPSSGVGETIPSSSGGGKTRIITRREPQGVVAAITPWNSPVAMVTRKVGAAIAAGNTAILKPASETPLSAIAMAKLFERAGFPPGVLNIVTCSIQNTPKIGELLCEHPYIKHLSFTGSSPVGKLLNKQCAAVMKRTSMELGGNAPFIVFEDVDLDKAVDGVISSKFRSSGQTCICANRVLVHEAIHDQFVDRLKDRTGELIRPGNVWDRATTFGPLYGFKGKEKVLRHISDATSKGGDVVLGTSHDDGTYFQPPTILVNSSPQMQLWREETFGPVASITKFGSEAEALRLANDSTSGLAAYVYTENISRLWRVAEALEVGMVGLRIGLISACEQPFGGVKDSGIGREGSSHALDEYTEIKSITLAI